MAEALYLVTRTDQGVTDDKNQVREVLVNADDGNSDAETIAEVIVLLNAAHAVETGAPAVYPAGYFDTVELVAVASGIMSTDGDFLAFTPRVASDLT